MLLYFHKFLKFCSVVKLNFAKVLPCHTFYDGHVDHLKNFLTILLKSNILQKFSDIKISWYTVVHYWYKTVIKTCINNNRDSSHTESSCMPSQVRFLMTCTTNSCNPI